MSPPPSLSFEPRTGVSLGGALNDVKLFDFDIARLVEGTRALALSGQVVGTVGYADPRAAEQWYLDSRRRLPHGDRTIRR